MARTAADVTPEEMEVYRDNVRRREAAYRAQVAERTEQAWGAAREAAAMLRERYGAKEVVLFGSLARGTFGLHSDVDLMARGIESKDWIWARVDAEDLCPGFAVDVVLEQDASERLASDIARDGVDLS